VPLFEHVGRRVFLTEAGQQLYAMCQKVFEAVSGFDTAIADMRGLKRGRLSLAAVTTAKYFVPRLLGGFCRRYPSIDVSLEVTNRGQVLARLRDNLDDLYVFGTPPQDVDVQATPFLHNPLIVLAAKDHPLAGKNRVSWSRLAQEPFIMREIGSDTRGAAERFFSERGVTVRVRMELGSNEAIKQAVIGGLGISILSRHAVEPEGSERRLAVLNVDEFPIMGQWHLVYRTGKQLSVIAQTFVDYVLSEKGNGLDRGTRS
jgi:DNA-binding transcriptional LysR family regulator